MTVKKPSSTRDKLLEVAFDLIWDSSYGSVSVDDICQRAGVNKGSFYHFFPTKADLAMAAYRARWEAVRPAIEGLFSKEFPPLERLRRWCAYVYQIQEEQARKFGHVCGCPYASVGAELATQDERIRASSEELIYRGRAYLESAIADAIAEGSVTVNDPVVCAHRAYSICLGMLFEAKVRNSLEVLRDLEPAVMQMLGASSLAVA